MMRTITSCFQIQICFVSSFANGSSASFFSVHNLFCIIFSFHQLLLAIWFSILALLACVSFYLHAAYADEYSMHGVNWAKSIVGPYVNIVIVEAIYFVEYILLVIYLVARFKKVI